MAGKNGGEGGGVDTPLSFVHVAVACKDHRWHFSDLVRASHSCTRNFADRWCLGADPVHLALDSSAAFHLASTTLAGNDSCFFWSNATSAADRASDIAVT